MRLAGSLLWLSLGMAFTGPAAAEHNGETLLDGISVLAGVDSKREADALPVLLSDVGFDAALLSAGLFGPREGRGTGPDQLRLEARRLAVLVRLLANQARQLQETANPREVAAIREAAVARVGGREAMARLLLRFGMDGEALDKWAENTVLASTQVRFALLQADTPFLERGPDAAPLDRSDPLYRQSERLRAERTAEAMKRWLSEVMAAYPIRIVR